MALYDLNNKVDQDNFKRALLRAYEKGALVELTTKKDGTLSQNNYFHLLVSYFALQYGEKVEYIKVEFIKKNVCSAIFATTHVNRKTGEIRDDWRSWTSLNKKERSDVIDMFLNWSVQEAGIRLPEPDDLQYIRECRTAVDKNKQYL